jgi:hypothetical protein
MQALAKEPGRDNIEVVSADLVAVPEAAQPADVLWLHLFYHDLHTALIPAASTLERLAVSFAARGEQMAWESVRARLPAALCEAIDSLIAVDPTERGGTPSCEVRTAGQVIAAISSRSVRFPP